MAEREISPPEMLKATRLESSLGKQPRQAALKAANKDKGYSVERARNKEMHIFTGERKQVNKPKNAPAWMPAMISARRWATGGNGPTLPEDRPKATSSMLIDAFLTVTDD